MVDKSDRTDPQGRMSVRAVLAGIVAVAVVAGLVIWTVRPVDHSRPSGPDSTGPSSSMPESVGSKASPSRPDRKVEQVSTGQAQTQTRSGPAGPQSSDPASDPGRRAPGVGISLNDHDAPSSSSVPSTPTLALLTSLLHPGKAARVRTSNTANSDSNSNQPEDDSPASIAGRVTDERGNPVVGMPVRLGVMHARLDSGRFGAQPRTALTDAQGRYAFSDLPAGQFEVAVLVAEESDYAEARPQQVGLGPGELRDDLNFILFSGDVLEGVVASEEGDPVEGAQIGAYVESRFRGNFRAATDAEGAYRIKGIPEDKPIEYLVASHPDYERQVRTRIMVIDGAQNFILKRLPGFQVVALDATTGSPVAVYEYRLFVDRGNGFRQAGGGATQVRNPEGRANLERLENGRYRIEAAELTDGGAPTGRRGALEFEATRENPRRELIVDIAGGRRIQGRVVLEDTGDPIEGARVAMTLNQPSSASGWRGLFLGQDAQSGGQEAVSDSSGSFVLESVPAGLQHLVARKEGFQLRNSVAIDVPADRDPEPVEIVMARSSTLYGRLVGFDGGPLANITLLHFDDQEYWGGRADSTFTDADGRYRLEGLLGGNHKLGFEDPASGLSDSKLVTLAPGEERELNFDYTGKVELTGQIHVDGAPWSGMPRMSIRPERMEASSMVEQAFATGFLSSEGGGRYKIFVKPGRHSLVVQTTIRQNFIAEWFDVAPGPYLQVRDFDLRLVDVDVGVAPPEGRIYQPGRLVFDRRVGQAIQEAVFNLDAPTEQRRTVNLLAGEYRVHYISEGTDDSGTSEWTMTGPGMENVIVVFAGQGATHRVGGWSPATLTREYKTHEFDITAALTHAGPCEVIVDYESGRSAVVAEWVAVLQDGTEISRDTHDGWSGFRKLNHVYHFTLPPPIAGARYALQVSLKGDGGTESVGTIYLRFPSPVPTEN